MDDFFSPGFVHYYKIINPSPGPFFKLGKLAGFVLFFCTQTEVVKEKLKKK
jgi:hypothetical protein